MKKIFSANSEKYEKIFSANFERKKKYFQQTSKRTKNIFGKLRNKRNIFGKLRKDVDHKRLYEIKPSHGYANIYGVPFILAARMQGSSPLADD